MIGGGRSFGRIVSSSFTSAFGGSALAPANPEISSCTAGAMLEGLEEVLLDASKESEYADISRPATQDRKRGYERREEWSLCNLGPYFDRDTEREEGEKKDGATISIRIDESVFNKVVRV